MRDRMSRLMRVLASLALDCAVIVASIAVTIFLYNYLLKVNAGYLPVFLRSILPVCAGCAVSFIAFGIYDDLWDYISLSALIRLAGAAWLASVLAFGSLRLVAGYWLSPIMGVTLFYLFATFAAAWRVAPSLLSAAKRRFLTLALNREHLTPLLIVGAGEAAAMLIKDIENQGSKAYHRVVGLVDDDTQKHHHTLRGARVLGKVDDIRAIAKEHGVQEIAIAIPSATTVQRKRIFSACAATGLKVRTMGRVGDLSDAAVTRLREVNVSDLLGRREVVLDPAFMATYITGKTVMVTGGGGSIGSELCRQISRFDPARLVIFDISENNAYNLINELTIAHRLGADTLFARIGSVQDSERLGAVLTEFSPDIIFHAAAYKHVPLMEECPELAIRNNVFGTHTAAQAAIAHGVKRFVMISTDKAVNPTNVMGASKRLAELVIQSLNGRGTEFVAVRFGNVLGSNGSVVPLFQRQIEAGGPVTLTHPDIIRYFMTIPEAARLVLQAGAMARGGETFVLDMGEPVKIYDLAVSMIEMAGLTPGQDIEIKCTGLRPGEKLYEELLIAGEGTEKTASDKIFVAHSEIPSDEERERILDALHHCLDEKDDVRACIKDLLPVYQPQD